MKEYNVFEPLKPADWTITREWIVNRCLFLIYMTDLNNELFHGGDALTLEQVKENYRRSFYPEYLELMKVYPNLFNRAFNKWLNEMYTGQIEYIDKFEQMAAEG